MDSGDGVLPAMITFPALMMAQLALGAIGVAALVGIRRGVVGYRDDPDASTWPAIILGLCVIVGGIAWPITGRWWYLPAVLAAMPLFWWLTAATSTLWRPVAQVTAAFGRAVGRMVARTARALARAVRYAARVCGSAAAWSARLLGALGVRCGIALARAARRAAVLGWPIVRGAALLAGTALRCTALWFLRRLALGAAHAFRRLRTWSRRDGEAWQRRHEWLHS